MQPSWKKVSEQKLSPQKMNFGEYEKEEGEGIHYTIACTKKFPGQSEAPQQRLRRRCWLSRPVCFMVAPGGNPQGHGERILTPHRSVVTGDWTPNLPAVRQQCSMLRRSAYIVLRQNRKRLKLNDRHVSNVLNWAFLMRRALVLGSVSCHHWDIDYLHLY